MIIRVYGADYELNEGTEVFVGRCGSGCSVFGERAYFTRATKQHLIFTTESGSVVKTDYYMNTIGKAAKNHYFVSLTTMDKRDNVTVQRVHYWNDKKVCFEYR